MNIFICNDEKINKKLNLGIEEYSKRLSYFTNISMIKQKQIKKNQDRSCMISLVSGKTTKYTSEDLAKLIEDISMKNIQNIYFLTDETEIETDYEISVSKWSLDKEMLILTAYEQIFRAFSIINNLKYHK